MTKSWLILLLGLLLGAAAFAVPYWNRTAKSRAMVQSAEPGLEWLKAEFNLNEDEFRKACELHEGYKPECKRMCALIESKEAELQQLLRTTNRVTEDIARILKEKAAIHAECQTKMLAHFYAVSQTMPADEGKRYLLWVQERTLNSGVMEHESDGQDGHEH